MVSYVSCMISYVSCNFFQKKLFQKILSGTLSECQMVWIHIKTGILSVLAPRL